MVSTHKLDGPNPVAAVCIYKKVSKFGADKSRPTSCNGHRVLSFLTFYVVMACCNRIFECG